MNLARGDRKTAYIRFKCLFVNGEKFTVEQLKERVVSDSLLPTEKDPKRITNTRAVEISELTTNPPNSPTPVARKEILNEQEHSLILEDSGTSRDTTATGQVLHKAKDWEELGRTRSQSQSSGGARREHKVVNPSSKIKKGS